MGAWGTGIFENDDAADWALRFEEDGFVAVEQAITQVLDVAPGYLERDLAANALAAAEVIAALRGRPGVNIPPDVRSLLAAHSGVAVDPNVVEDARRALDHAADPSISEVAELWAGTPDETAWRAVVADLRARLA